MRNWFKICLTCLGSAIALRLAFEGVTGEGVEMPKSVEMPKAADQHAYIMPGKVAVEWSFTDTTKTWDKGTRPETRVWLSIENANHRDWPVEGYNPSYTAVFVKDCVPVVRKLGENRYEIAFRSEVAKDLP